jgi:hypothetical protein
MSDLGYYYVLSFSYAVALLGWWLIRARFEEKLRHGDTFQIQKPWLQVACIVASVIAILLIGRLYSNHLLLAPMTVGVINLSECINQLLIFSPVVLFLFITKQPITSAWLPGKSILLRLTIGIGLAIAAMIVFVALSNGHIVEVGGRVFHLKNLHFAIQVFMEDLGLALLLSRLSAALGKRYFYVGLIVAAALFAGAHLPANLEEGRSLGESLFSLTLDAGVVAGVGLLLYRSRDFLWFFPIHFAMDMMQFYSAMMN